MDTEKPIDTHSIKRRFIALNKDRVDRINKSLRWRQRHFLKLLPLLFHINDESLPGYVSEDTPVGISNYKPLKASIDAAKKINKKFRHSSRALSRYSIHSIFLTGSSGTIAQTDASDFDIWLCHKPDMTEDDLKLLEAKSKAISNWCASLELEVHFFLMDEHRFRSKSLDSLDSEHSGTAQHHLLLEEFYRTGVYLAGRYPLWWLVPPEHDHDYDNHVAYLIKQKKINEFEVINFGGLNNIPAGEFFGASLWQIYKGIDSPYKSVLKILLMESYANEYPNIDLLCSRLKKSIYNNVSDLAEIDPYLMMCHKVEEYLTSRDESQRLELARRCFYFKVDLHLSKNKHTNDLRSEMLIHLVSQWGWDDAHLLMLDSRRTWKINRVIEERKKLVDELTRSYKLLSSFANQYSDSADINQRDMTILGRKLYAAFERKSGKVDIVNPGISPNLFEDQLSFVETDDKWLLFRGNVALTERSRNTPLKLSHSIIELFCWCHFNHLISQNTIINLNTTNNSINLREVKQILSSLDSQFPHGGILKNDINLFSKASHTVRTILFINVGINPMSIHNREDRQLVSSRTNAFSYSGLLDNLVLSIDQVSINTWQEIYSHNYLGINEVMECLCKNIQMSSVSNNNILPIMNAFSFTSTLDHTLARRIETLFNDVIRFFHRSDISNTARFIIGVENNYYLLQEKHSEQAKPQVSYKRIGSYNTLLESLSHAEPTYSPVVFDKLTLQDHFLPKIYANHHAGKIDFYAHVEGNIVNIYVLDEKGALFCTHHNFFNLQATMAHYDAFLYASLQRLNAYCLDHEHAEPLKVHFNTLREMPRHWEIKPYQIDPLLSDAVNPFEITVIIELNGDNIQYRIFCNDREFSSLQYEDTLFEHLAEHIISLRHGNADYPLYITDIDLPLQPFNTDAHKTPQTVNYLQYKIKFEQQLNSALSSHFTKQPSQLS